MKRIFNHSKILLIAILWLPLLAWADFDRTNPADLLALQTEVLTDPIGMGYNPAAGTPPLLDLLNNPDANIGGETVAATLTVRLLIAAIVPDDLTVGSKLSQGQLDWIKLLIGMTSYADEDIETWRPMINGIFSWSPTPQTRTNLDAQNRTLSRVEVLFGAGTVVSKDDWLAARDYTN